MEFSSINLIDESKEIIVPFGYGSNNFKSVPFVSVVEGEEYSISVSSINLLQGEPVSGYRVMIWNYTDDTLSESISNYVDLNPDSGTLEGVLKITKTVDKTAFVLYSGIPGGAANKSVAYHNVMLVRGNHPSKV